ncbi:hypothetical protein K492DRAFT_108134, partial [Lichtheimia hyalospora FSU 10163]
ETIQYLTVYEKANIIGERAKQLSIEYKKRIFTPLVTIDKTMIKKDGDLDFIKIAEKELVLKKIPFLIKRLLPNKKF